MSTIPRKQLGANGPWVPALGFGLMGLSSFAGDQLPDEDRLALLDRAFELGETFWDTSDTYGDSEDLLGKWFARNPGKRAEVFLATKFGGVIEGDDMRTAKFYFRSDAEHVKAACGRSLARLGVDCIDLFYCHRVDEKTPIERTVQAMADLKQEGKIKHIGLCEISAATLRRAHAVHPVAAVQVEYSPFSTDIEDPRNGLLAACRELGVAVVAYSPLSRGLVTGRYRAPKDLEEGDVRRLFPRFSEENLPANLRLVEVLRGVAEGKGCTAGQLVLAWLMAQQGAVFPIPGTRKIKYLEENVGATSVHLGAEEIAEIQKAVDAAEVAGDRYPEQMAVSLFADTPEL